MEETLTNRAHLFKQTLDIIKAEMIIKSLYNPKEKLRMGNLTRIPSLRHFL
jgi:hypothetical protein